MRPSNTSHSSRLHTILVPLDGSELAERALPVASHLAYATSSGLLLVQALPTPTWMYAQPDPMLSAESYQQVLDDQEHAARQYLEQRAESLRPSGIRVETLALHGEPASTLIDLAPQVQAGLVVMASHGRTGLARFALGSVTDRVTRAGSVPVLIVRPFGEDRRPVHLEQALVSLDGSELAEQALEVVDALAGAVVQRVTLARVVDDDPPADALEEAERYLDQARARLAARLGGRVCAVATAMLHGRVAEQLIDRAERGCDLVIMATHGRTGAERWAYGSIADRVLHGIHKPLLLVRPPSQA